MCLLGSTDRTKCLSMVLPRSVLCSYYRDCVVGQELQTIRIRRMKFFQDKEARRGILSLLLISAILWVIYGLFLFISTQSTIFIFKFLYFCFLISALCTSVVTIGNALLTIGNENGGLNKLTLSILIICSLIIAFVMDYGHPEGFLNEPVHFLNWGRILVTLGLCAFAYKLVDSKINVYKAFMITWIVTFVFQIIGLGESDDLKESLRDGGMGLSFIFQTWAIWLAIWLGSRK